MFRGGDEGQTKKEARVRVVPIVLGLPQIKQWPLELHRWLNNITDKVPPATLNRKLRKLLDDNSPDVNGRSFRHTWVRLANRPEISVRHEHAIGGWKKRNDTELNRVLAVVYDPHGFVEDNVLLEKVQSAQQAVFARWLDAPSSASMNNLVSFTGSIDEMRNFRRLLLGSVLVSLAGVSWGGFDGCVAGDCSNGKGKGKYTFANGDVYEGDFMGDQMHGEGKVTFAHGPLLEGFFEYGNYLGAEGSEE